MDIAIVLNGPKLELSINEPYIICVDGGYNLLPYGKKPDIILGDMDSIGEIPVGIEVRKIPAIKDYTDGEYAVRYAAQITECEEIHIYGALGGRPDHVLANLGLLRLADTLGKKAIIIKKGILVTYETGKTAYYVEIGDIISVISAEGPAVLEKAKGLFYEVKDLALNALDSRGISNIATSKHIELWIKNGGIFLFRIKKENI